ncbi:hypothetical protein BD309DRAFT_866158 [Dichomitus squalens]|nr:hypothetical protein BD309DRAFT_866158 [Dichomitus squalens]
MTRSPEPPKKIACTNCSRKKTRCENSADGRPCATCTQKRLDCRYPDPDAPGSGGAQRRTSCDSCHKEKVRCRRAKDGEDDTRCMNCREKNIQCVFPNAGEHEELPVADSEQPVAGPSRSQAASSVHRGQCSLPVFLLSSTTLSCPAPSFSICRVDRRLTAPSADGGPDCRSRCQYFRTGDAKHAS